MERMTGIDHARPARKALRFGFTERQNCRSGGA
jgi:hypothetical protein